jgi:hypothetical protein
MPTCSGCGDAGKELKFANYPNRGRLWFCGLKCQQKFHLGDHVPAVMRTERKHISINAIVEAVVDHRTLAVTFIPYGLSFVDVNIMQYRDGPEKMDYDQARFDMLSEMLAPITREDGMTYYAICHIDITDVKDGIIRAVVHVPHACNFDKDTLMAICEGDEGKLLNLSKVMTGMADRKMSDATMETYVPEASKYVGRAPMHLHLKKGAFTKDLKRQHLLKGKATRIPEKTIKKVLHSKSTSKLERKRAQFAENARHWNHHHGHRGGGGSESTK